MFLELVVLELIVFYPDCFFREGEYLFCQIVDKYTRHAMLIINFDERETPEESNKNRNSRYQKCQELIAKRNKKSIEVEEYENIYSIS